MCVARRVEDKNVALGFTHSKSKGGDRPVLTCQELSERNGGLGLFSANDMSDMDVGRS